MAYVYANQLNMRVNRNSTIPYYYQLKEIIRSLIEINVLKEDKKIPTENKICRVFGISRAVLRQAIDELINEGLLIRRKKGTFVAGPKVTGSLIHNLNNSFKDMKIKKLRTKSKVLEFSVIKAGRRAAEILWRNTDEKLFKINRLRFINNKPRVYVITYIPYDLCPELIDEDFDNTGALCRCGRKIWFKNSQETSAPLRL